MDSVRFWVTQARTRRRERYAEKRGFITTDELQEVKENTSRLNAGYRGFVSGFNSQDQDRPRH